MIKKVILSFLLLVIYQYSFCQKASVQCDDKLWDHVYHKERLKVLNKCMEVTGTVFEIRKEKDGDAHILLYLDKGQDRCYDAGKWRASGMNLVKNACPCIFHIRAARYHFRGNGCPTSVATPVRASAPPRPRC